ncbi:hypothetical protein C7212DRAFT_343434 [Tuber magnatum]|uniref:Trichome differentiation protein GL1 n=1 Tax=Tuber magnatum TaxID=42249 RepID=A0A317STL0_9PEZI|nr:hypothetical protein C7212DRAFT_343434 [Tuber magnatum]
MLSLQQPHRRGPWSAHEDAHLLSLVQLHGPHNWVRIASLVNSRTPKQCRERYHQNLKPSLNHDPITPEEGVMIERLVGEMGKRWAEIARRLHGRSDNAVKNWWNGGMNRRRRMCLRQRSQSHNLDNTNTATTTASSGGINRHPEDNMSQFATPQYSPVGRNLTIDVSRGHHHDTPLSSPAYTESSGGQTPGLVSDAASAFSVSPRMPPSPMSSENTLPPLLPPHGVQHRRTSLPILQVPGEPRITEYDSRVLSFTRRHSSTSRDFEIRSRELPYTASSLSNPASAQRYSTMDSSYHCLRHKVPQYDSNRDPVIIRDPDSSQQDTRMNLSSILD